MKKLLAWVKERFTKTSQHDTNFWRVMTQGLWLATGAAVLVAGRGTPTGLGLLIDLVIYSTLHIISFFLIPRIAAFLLSLMYLPIPRLFVSSLLYTGFTAYLDRKSVV